MSCKIAGGLFIVWRMLGKLAIAILLFGTPGTLLLAQQRGLGIFQGSADVGKAEVPGAAEFDPTSGVYIIDLNGPSGRQAGDGHYLWRRMSGDVTLGADVYQWSADGPEVRMGIMLRAGLEADAPYMSLSWSLKETVCEMRDAKGGEVRRVHIKPMAGCPRLMIEKKGDDFVVHQISNRGDEREAVRVTLGDAFYAGFHVNSSAEGGLRSYGFGNVEFFSGSREQVSLGR